MATKMHKNAAPQEPSKRGNISPSTRCGRCGHPFSRHAGVNGRCHMRPYLGSPMRCDDGSCGCGAFLDDRRGHDPRSVTGLARRSECVAGSLKP